MSVFKKFKDAKHPDAKSRREAVDNAVLERGVKENSKEYFRIRSIALSAAMDVFHLSESFLMRQYYHRDCALEALNNGDVAEALKHLNMIGDSGHEVKV